MPNHQDIKALVLNFYEELEAASADHVGRVLNRFTTSDYRFRGVHPFNEIDGADAVADTLWKPLFSAFTPMQRRQDIFMAGTNVDAAKYTPALGLTRSFSRQSYRHFPTSSFKSTKSIGWATTRTGI